MLEYSTWYPYDYDFEHACFLNYYIVTIGLRNSIRIPLQYPPHFHHYLLFHFHPLYSYIILSSLRNLLIPLCIFNFLFFLHRLESIHQIFISFSISAQIETGNSSARTTGFCARGFKVLINCEHLVWSIIITLILLNRFTVFIVKLIMFLI